MTGALREAFRRRPVGHEAREQAPVAGDEAVHRVEHAVGNGGEQATAGRVRRIDRSSSAPPVP